MLKYKQINNLLRGGKNVSNDQKINDKYKNYREAISALINKYSIFCIMI